MGRQRFVISSCPGLHLPIFREKKFLNAWSDVEYLNLLLNN